MTQFAAPALWDFTLPGALDGGQYGRNPRNTSVQHLVAQLQ
jgi:hypothetical protein